MKRLGLLSLLVLVVACGSSPMGSDDDNSQPDGSTAVGTPDAGGGGGPDAYNPPADSYTVQWGPITVPPGENTMCVTKRVGNAGTVYVNQIHNVLGATSHHFIVYTVGDTVEQPDPYDCQPFTDTLDANKGAPLMITQRRDELLTMPAGVGYTLQPDQMVRLELHFINATESDQVATATTTFIPMTADEFQNEADFLFMGDIDIDLPAGASVTVGPTWFPLPSEFYGVNFFALTGHEHQLGTNVAISTAPAEAGPDTPVYQIDNFLWSEPETVRYNPGFTVPDGGGFRFSCDYENTSGHHVGFGESVNDEMCFFWAYYYPSHGHKVCFQTDQFGGVTLCCPGNSLCSQLPI